MSASATTSATGNAYATLLTRPSYLAGAILLASTLKKHTQTPLIIIYTPETLPQPCIAAIDAEAKHSNIIPHAVEHLRLPTSSEQGAGSMVAERFADTWTKLRVFEMSKLCEEKGIGKLCFLDADMMIFRNPDDVIFDMEVGLAEDELRATHVCVCNLDGDAWAPKAWTKENCAYTPLEKDQYHRTGLAQVHADDETRGIMNTGTFLFRPSVSIEDLVVDAFSSYGTERLRAYKFPDQDFLNDVFKGKWRALHWSANALKTWRYWHPNLWTDEEVRVLHYIVDKPWAARVGDDGKAGYRGDDGVTHTWWWREYEGWKTLREKQGETERREAEIVTHYVAGTDGKDHDELRAIGGGAQDYAKKWDVDEQKHSHRHGHDRSVSKAGHGVRKILGEHGHGPVQRDCGNELSASANEPQLESGAGPANGGPIFKGTGKDAKGSSLMSD